MAWRWSFYTSPKRLRNARSRSAARLRTSTPPNAHGIHSGPVSGVVDVNNRPNLAGAGLNIAQRVMDCGDAGHILLSKHVAKIWTNTSSAAAAA